MIRIREAVLVEGRYDKNTLSQVVDTAIFETGGFGILKDKERIEFLRQVAAKRGLVIFTDSDGAGFVIRNRLKSLLPPQQLLQAYIPQIAGKEKRKQKSGKEGLLGVEGMTPDVLIESLRRCGAHFLDDDAPLPAGGITRQDLYAWGLMGGEDSREKRELLKRHFGLPFSSGHRRIFGCAESHCLTGAGCGNDGTGNNGIRYEKIRNHNRLRIFFHLCYPRIIRSLLNSSPEAVLNFSSRSSTVSFFFSSPEMSRTTWPSFIMISRLPWAMASCMLWVIIRVVRWSRSTIWSVSVQHLGGSLGVQGGGVLVQQQQLGLLQGGHQQGQRLALAAGEQAHLGGQPVLQAQIQDLQQLPVLLPLGLGDAGAEGAAPCRGARPGPGSPRSAWWRRCPSWGPGTRGR